MTLEPLEVALEESPKVSGEVASATCGRGARVVAGVEVEVAVMAPRGSLMASEGALTTIGVLIG